MKPCFGYIRVSTQKQGEGVSLEAQKDAIMAFASRNHLSIIEWFEEKETAAKSGRPIFLRMLKLLEQRKAEGLIIHKIDRSARNLKDWAVIGELSDQGINVYFATESLDFRSRGGRLTADIQAVIAADYIRNLREETLKGLNGRLKQGLYPWGAPIGYLNNGQGKAKTPDPVKAPLVRELFDLYSTGSHSLRSLQKVMVLRGLWNGRNRPVSLTGIETILGNSFYCGIIRMQKTGMQYDGIHEPLISVALFNRVQDIKAGRYHQKVTCHGHLYRGLFRCGLCAGPMIAERQKGHVYYRCHNATCATKTVREEVLSDAINCGLRCLQIDEADTARFADDLAAINPVTALEEQRTSLLLRIADETSRLDRMTDLMIDGTLDKATFQEKQNALQFRLAALRESLASLPDPKEIEANRRQFLELMKSLARLHENADQVGKRQLVENCFSNRRVIGKNVLLEPYNWLQEAKNSSYVFSGALDRDTDRTGKSGGKEKSPLEKLLDMYDQLLNQKSHNDLLI